MNGTINEGFRNGSVQSGGGVHMSNLIYVQASNKLPALFERIAAASTPSKVDRAWLSAAGFESNRDYITLLKRLGFVDASNIPTATWQKYKNMAVCQKVMGEAVRGAYADLFRMYPDAPSCKNAELRSFFASVSPDVSEATRKKSLSTFRVLCGLAVFDTAEAPPVSLAPIANSEAIFPQPVTNTELNVPDPEDRALVVNINIQLSIPETSDDTVYDRFFAAMKTHLF